MKVFCISQARMGSTRLPAKVLKTINNKTLLQYQMERVLQARTVNQYIVATTISPADLAIVDFCHHHDIAYYRGDEHNVLSRFYHTAKSFNAQENDLIIRLTSDCPLVAPELIDEVVNQHLKDNYYAISNVDIHSYPRGFDVEVFSMGALTIAFNNAVTPFEQEHVTPYFYRHQQQFPSQSIHMPLNKIQKTLRLCVDELADFELMNQLIINFPNNIITASAKDIIDFLYQHPEIATINQNVQQKSG